MRNLFVRVVTAAALMTGTAALVHQGSASGQPLVPGVVDVAVAIESKPATVSPPGELALYAVTVSNKGLVDAASSVTVTLASGSSYRDDLSTAACTGSGTTATCAIPTQAPGASTLVEVIGHTPPTAGLKTVAADVAVIGLVEPLEYTADNHAETTTDVQLPNPNIAAGLVEEGDSLTLEVGDGRIYTLTVPQGVPGVIVRKLAPQSGFAKTCGLGGCGDGFVLDFVPHPYFKAEDPTNPLETDKTFGTQDPCRGLGACADIYAGDSELTTLLTQMPDCAVPGDATPPKCVNQRYKKAGSNAIWWDVRLLSNDPIELPPTNFGR